MLIGLIKIGKNEWMRKEKGKICIRSKEEEKEKKYKQIERNWKSIC